jgi:uncharacterized protein (TIGR00299 family) protein
MVDRAPLAPPIREKALAILSSLGEAEARVHGVDVRELELHQLGEDDTIIDVVGIAAAICSLGIDQILVSSIPLAVGGQVETPHGRLPLPAPATAELLRGFFVRGDGVGELVTPTAAAVLSALAQPATSLPLMRIGEVGYGAGTHDPVARPNVVRVLVGLPVDLDSAVASPARKITVLETNLDDLSPELVADAAEALRSAGALDVWVTHAQMKKGRPGVVLTAICRREDEERLTTVFFESTTTLGVRSSVVGRLELEREIVDLPTSQGHARVKLGLLGGRIISVKPEHDDVVELARQTDRPVRAVHDELVALARSSRMPGDGTSPSEHSSTVVGHGQPIV